MRLGVHDVGGRFGAVWLAASIFASPAGCVQRGNTAILEGRLRAQEERVAVITQENETLISQLTAARRESEMLHKQVAGDLRLFPEQTHAASVVESIHIQRLLSGYTDGESPAVKLVVQPLDSDGEIVRSPGQFRIIARLASPADETESADEAESAQQVSVQVDEPPVEWRFSADETEEAWHAGFGRGYHFSLPVAADAQKLDLEFKVVFLSVDGRQFESSEVIPSPDAN